MKIFHLRNEIFTQICEIISNENKTDDKTLCLDLNFDDGEIKEGCMTIRLMQDESVVYHMNFWIGKIDKENKQVSAYIGCHQGSKDGLDINKDLTKQLFGCRPKNFVFIALQDLLSHLGITELYAVSSEGHYSNKFHGDKRKPKVSYNDFWTECGGTICPDKRFFSMPLHDKRNPWKKYLLKSAPPTANATNSWTRSPQQSNQAAKINSQRSSLLIQIPQFYVFDKHIKR